MHHAFIRIILTGIREEHVVVVLGEISTGTKSLAGCKTGVDIS